MLSISVLTANTHKLEMVIQITRFSFTEIKRFWGMDNNGKLLHVLLISWKAGPEEGIWHAFLLHTIFCLKVSSIVSGLGQNGHPTLWYGEREQCQTTQERTWCIGQQLRGKPFPIEVTNEKHMMQMFNPLNIPLSLVYLQPLSLLLKYKV